jgi:membrane associated rhomboid family serine protease
MEQFLNSLERRFGKYAFDNLTLVLVTAQAAALVLSLARPGFAQLLVLDPAYVHAGQYWRLISYLFLPASFEPLWALFALYWLYTMGTALEGQWGAFKYQLYWFVGTLLTAVGAFTFDVPATNTFLLMSLFLAFATLWPTYEIRIFFILPVQVRWLALLDALLICMEIGGADGWAKLVPVLAIGNYFLFFGAQLVALLRGRAFQASRKREQRSFSRSREDGPAAQARVCATCGVTSILDPEMDFRVCTCAKHDGKPTTFCIEHARNH